MKTPKELDAKITELQDELTGILDRLAEEETEIEKFYQAEINSIDANTKPFERQRMVDTINTRKELIKKKFAVARGIYKDKYKTRIESWIDDHIEDSAEDIMH